jgi:hypothetical protein
VGEVSADGLSGRSQSVSPNVRFLVRRMRTTDRGCVKTLPNFLN